MSWKNVQYENGKYQTSSGGGGGGASNLSDLDDTNISSPTNGQVLKYNGTSSKWENANESGGGGTVTDVTVGGTSVVNGQGVAEVPAITAVEANPQGSASTDLTKLKVGAINYNIPSNLHTYSTTEQIVGTWINSKPLYEKTINVGALTQSSSWVDVAHNISNISKVVSLTGVALDGSFNIWYPLPIARDGSQITIIGANATNIRYINSWLGNATECYVTLRYTKTTD